MFKRKENQQPLGDVIKAIVKSNSKLAQGLLKIRILNAWKTVTGDTIAKKTLDVSYQDRILFVKLDSAALRHELSHSQTKIINMIHEEVGVNNLVEKIILR